jgi:flagellar hook protein FlgE
MGVIGNNLANSNTAGFKASRTLFSDLIPDTVSGSGGTSQVGRGSGLSTVDDIFTQGSIESTSSSLDLAIEGTGFFMVRNPDAQASSFTRSGAFRLNEEGYMINPEGYIVQGYARVPGTQSFEDLTSDIQINTRSSVPGEASTQVDLTTNLDANATPTDPFDLDDPVGTSNFATTSEIYDSLGNTHLVTTYFRKTDTNNQWEYYQTVPQDDLDGGTPGEIEQVGSGSLTFDESGLLQEITTDHDGTTYDQDSPEWPNINTIAAGELNWNNGAEQGEELNYNMSITQFSTESRVVTQQSDGYSSGYLTDISVDMEGIITGTYSNGESRSLARLALGKFANDNGLEKLGNNLYGPTRSSGPADIGTPGAGFGRIFSNSLEQSTVDIAEEFTRMITTQRAFQANSKTITTTDEMLSEVINMKR